MNLEQLKARMAEVFAKLQEFENKETMTEVDAEDFNALHGEFNSLKATIEAKEKIEAIKNASTRVTTNAATPRVEVKATREEKNGGFKAMGDFLMAVKKASNGEIDSRFQNSAHNTRVGEDGGFLVPEDMMTEVQKKIESDESLLARARQFRISGNTLTLPIDEKAPWNGGISVLWTAEANSITSSKFNLPGFTSFKLNKAAALVPVTDELLEDAVALESFIRSMAPEAFMHKMNEAILTGNGVGKPTGILNSGFKVKVAKESGQTADTIVARNVIKMYSTLLPSSYGRAAWYINAMCIEQLRMMKDDNGNFIYLAPGSQMNQSPYGLLLGLPVIPMIGSLPALGDEGDIILADLSYYYAVLKSNGLKQSVSSHLYFDRDMQAYKFTFRIDGKCPFSAPVTTQYGAYEMSSIITLEDR